jgi:hypothetical protein
MNSARNEIVVLGRIPNGSLPDSTTGDVFMNYTDLGAGEPWGCWYLLNASQRAAPSPSYSATASPFPDTHSASSCCPLNASVKLEVKLSLRMAIIQIGDRVYIGDGMYSEVFMFTHNPGWFTIVSKLWEQSQGMNWL